MNRDTAYVLGLSKEEKAGFTDGEVLTAIRLDLPREEVKRFVDAYQQACYEVLTERVRAHRVSQKVQTTNA